MSDPQTWAGAEVRGSRGELLGHVGSVYSDNATGAPAWIAVLGSHHAAVVPLAPARFDGRVLHVPFDAAQLRSAPHHDPTSLLSYQDGDDLARHYGLLPPAPPNTPDTSTPDAGAVDAGAVDVGAGDGMVRSEEQVRVHTVTVPVGRARLVTYIVTEQQTFTIPVSRQEVRLVYDPLPPSEQVPSDTPLVEDTYEVVRHTEQVLFTKQIVPIERVRMVTRVVTATRTVTTPVRSEQLTLTHHNPDAATDTPATDTPATDTPATDTPATDTDTGTGSGAVSEPEHPRTGDRPWD